MYKGKPFFFKFLVLDIVIYSSILITKYLFVYFELFIIYATDTIFSNHNPLEFFHKAP